MVATENDVGALSFPKLLVEVRNGTPHVFLVRGFREAMIFRRVALSPKSLAFSDIMYFSAQL